MNDQAYLEQAYGVTIDPAPYGNGHINDTYITTSYPRLILQRINTTVFTDPEKMMQNILAVTAFLKDKLQKDGKDADRCTLTVVPTKNGQPYIKVGKNFYRAYLFIEDTQCFDLVTPTTLEMAGYSFGEFQKHLSDFPAQELTEVIPHFHDTPVRFQTFLAAVEQDVCGRAEQDKTEIAFFKAHAAFMRIVADRLSDGRLPLAVTHNDTKINNILFDAKTGKGLCVIDLDTVMPGSRLYDFGDALRTGAAIAAEDEQDLSLVGFDEEKFAAFTKGYLTAVGNTLTKEEIALLPESALLLTLECGMRFLTDDLQGDVYFRIRKDRHNLIRARNQIRQATVIEQKLPLLHEIVNKCLHEMV